MPIFNEHPVIFIMWCDGCWFQQYKLLAGPMRLVECLGFERTVGSNWKWKLWGTSCCQMVLLFYYWGENKL